MKKSGIDVVLFGYSAPIVKHDQSDRLMSIDFYSREPFEVTYQLLKGKQQAAGSHEIWYNEQTDRYTTVPNHPGDMPEGTLRAILKETGINPNNFLKKK